MNFSFHTRISHRPTIILLILLAFCVQANSQKHDVDSLNKRLVNASDTLRIKILNELSWHYKNINVDSSAQYARKALTLAQKKNQNNLIADSYNSLGSAKQASGEYDSALFFLNQAIHTKANLGDTISIANVLNNIGIIYDEKGNYDKALENYFKGLRIAKKTGDETLQAYILSNIGVVYKKQKQYSKVLEYYDAALTIYKKLKSTFGIAVTSGNIGSVMLQTGDFEKSMSYSLRAKKGYEDLGYIRYVPYTLGNMAIAYDSLHQTGKAEVFYKEAFNQHLKFENQYEAAYNAKNLVFFYLKHNEISKANSYAYKAIQLARQISAKEMLRDAYLAMSKIFARKQQFKEAYNYLSKFNALKDSLSEEGKIKKIFELQVKYETELKERKLFEQKAELALRELQLQESNNRVIILASSSLLLIIIGFLLYQSQNTRRKKLEQEAQFKLQLAEIKLESELQQDRLRISRELHDNIGSRLLFLYTATDNLAEIEGGQSKEKILQISSFARNTLHELRRTVWFINKDRISLDELQNKLSEYFSFLNQTRSLTVHFEMNGDHALLLRSSLAEAIFRVAQEAVSNSIKHARAKQIDLKLHRHENGAIELVVTDDGVGFDSNKEYEGNGVRNMKLHAATVQGTITLSSRAGQGTSITFLLPNG